MEHLNLPGHFYIVVHKIRKIYIPFKVDYLSLHNTFMQYIFMHHLTYKCMSV